jgi:hypothetical protein
LLIREFLVTCERGGFVIAPSGFDRALQAQNLAKRFDFARLPANKQAA